MTRSDDHPPAVGVGFEHRPRVGSGQPAASAYDGSGAASSQPQKTAPPTVTRTRSAERAKRTVPPPGPGSAPVTAPGVRARSGPGRGRSRRSVLRRRTAERSASRPRLERSIRAARTRSPAPARRRPRASRRSRQPSTTSPHTAPSRKPPSMRPPSHRPRRARRLFSRCSPGRSCRARRAPPRPSGPADRPHRCRCPGRVRPALAPRTITWHRPAQSPGGRSLPRTAQQTRPAHTQRRVPSGSRPMTTPPAPTDTPEPLWSPGPERIAGARLTRFHDWAAGAHGAPAARPGDPQGSYADLHAWSVDEPDGVLAGDHRVVRRPLLQPVRHGARRPGDARRPLVPRCDPQLRRARAAPRRRPRPGRAARAAPPGRAARDRHRELGGAQPPGRRPRRRAAPPRRHPRRPGQRLPAQRRAGGRRPARHRGGRRRVDLLRPGLRRPQRPGPLPAGRAGRAVRRRRLPLRRQDPRPHRRRRRTARRAAHAPRHRAHPAARHPGPRRRPGMGPVDLGRRGTGLRAGAVRPPAVGAVLLGHHRTAQGHRPVAGRHPARTPQADRPPPRPRPRRPLLLVHLHRLDDVELPRLRPALRRHRRPLRRQPRLS